MKKSSPNNGSMAAIPKSKELLEKLAQLEHEQWMAWSKSIARCIDPKTRSRWKRYWVPYAKLSEEAKEQDRAWARKILRALSRHMERRKRKGA